MALSYRTALALMQGFQKDYILGRLPDEAMKELNAEVGYFSYSWHIRSFIGQTAKFAADAAWDKQWKKAIRFLMKNDLVKNCGKSAAELELQQVRNAVYYNTKRRNDEVARVNALFAGHRRSEQWKVCK